MAEQEIAKVYNPEEVEKRWSAFWEDKGIFGVRIESDKEPFTIVIPPPNVTGSLHIGHALNDTLQDVVVRRKRMAGYPTLWLPGTDHAGIATQNVVEQQLAQEGLTRDQVGREEFIRRTWEWREKYGGRISHQLKRLGASCDWSRERFTLDERYSKAVRTVFVRLYEEGLIYRDFYIVNWCPRCETALADIEVEYKEVEGKLYFVKYRLRDEADFLVAATTRPETILGDTALAVNPNDERYREYVGKTAIVPIIEREVPIIADDYVDPEFGTGVLKVTPAHDQNDFEIGQRHNLERVNALTPQGRISESGGAYKGLDRYEARDKLIHDLTERGLLEKTEPYTHSVGVCYRCGTVIEPYLSRQWFIKMKSLAEPAIKAVEESRVKFIPKGWTRTYFDWMDNIRDWVISRQIWWGHQIPVWYCEECGETLVAMEKPDSCPKCPEAALTQDPDVLDTWFSSALWPFATLGWPEKTEDLKYFYPTSLLVTSHDIIYFWVARMIMMGLHFMEDVPFHEVYIHALVRDVYGRKMSKSRGNVIDPLEIIERYGTDAMRFTLSMLATPGRDVYLSEEKIEGNRNFANKIWNASRFVMMNLEGYEPLDVPTEELTLPDRWIISRLNRTIEGVDAALDVYNFSEASRLIYNFFWSDFADWYIELSKSRLYQPKEPKDRLRAQNLLLKILDATLRLLHPFMPFITEELWHLLPAKRPGVSKADRVPSIARAVWPSSDKRAIDDEAEAAMGLVQAVTSSVRAIKAVLGIPLTKPVAAILRVPDADRRVLLEKESDYLKKLAWIDSLTIADDIEKPEHSALGVEAGVEIYVPLAGLVDIAEERRRLTKHLRETEEDLAKTENKLSKADFLAKAAPPIIEKEQEKLAALSEKKEKIELQLQTL